MKLIENSLTAALIGLTFLRVGPAFAAAYAAAGVRLLSDGEGMVSFAYDPQIEELKEVELDGARYRAARITGAGAAETEPGRPDLPVRVVLVGIRPGARVSVRLTDLRARDLPGPPLVPVPEIRESPDGGSPPVARYRPGPLYRTSALYPPQPVRLAGYGIVRGLHVAEIHLYPLQQGGGGGALRLNEHMAVEVTAEGGEEVTPAILGSAWQGVLETTVINFDRARRYVGRPRRPSPRPRTQVSFPPSGDMVRIEIDKTGLYAVTGADLAAVGVNLATVNPGRLRLLTTDGLPLATDTVRAEPKPWIEAAVSVRDAGSIGVMDPGDQILFYAVAPSDWADRIMDGAPADRYFRHPYVDRAVYWLTWSVLSGEPARIAEMAAPAAPADVEITGYRERLQLERNRLFDSSWEFEGAFGDPRNPWDPWYWNIQKATRIDYPFLAPGPLVSDSVIIIAGFKGRTTDSSHRAEVYLNGATVGETNWDTGRIQRATFRAGGLRPDSNRIAVEHIPSETTSGVQDEIYVNYFSLFYDRVPAAVGGGFHLPAPGRAAGVVGCTLTGFGDDSPIVLDVTDRFHPIRRAGLTRAGDDYRLKYQADSPTVHFVAGASDIRTPAALELRTVRPPDSKPADYLLIAHDDLGAAAGRLASWRGDYLVGFDPPSARLATTSSIYDQFSGGCLDPAAIRNFLAWCYYNYSTPPGYACFLGDGVLDFHNFSGSGRVNLVPPYTRPTGVMFVQGYDTDEAIEDWFAYIDGDDKLPDMIVGRLPAAGDDHAGVMVDKTVDYESRPEFGPWRVNAMLVADDERTLSRTGEIVHTRETELIANTIVPDDLQIERLYLMDYPRDTDNPYRKTGARLDLLGGFDLGRLLVNYIGHGSEFQWAHEHILEIADIRSLDNGARLPLVYAPSCDISKFDRFEYDAMGEEFLRAEGRGAIAVIASTRLGYIGPNEDLNQEFYRRLFAAPGYNISLGRALLEAKLLRGENSNDRRYSVFGDPALRLGLPHLAADRIELEVTSDYGDTLRRGGLAALSGRAKSSDGSPFSGFCDIEVRDSEYAYSYTNPESTVVNFGYRRDGLPIFSGPVEVVDGSFRTEFRVPVTAREGSLARVQTYLWNGTEDGAVAADSLPLFGMAEAIDDKDGPQIEITIGEGLLPAQLIKGRFTVTVRLQDPSGININSNTHRWGTEQAGPPVLFLSVALKDQPAVADTFALAPYFRYLLDSNTRGTASTDLDLSPGIYSLTVHAEDNLGNPSQASTDLEVAAEDLLQIRQVVNYPNPITETTWFTYQLTHEAEVGIRIFTVAGRLVRSIEPASGNFDYNQEYWDGTDDDGDRLANGVYLYRISAAAMISDDFGRLKLRRASHIGRLFVYR